MRYALKVFYYGRDFSGSQVQPGKRTVEGELLRALSEIRIGADRFQAAGRTDGGVSALGNVFAVSTKSTLRVRQLNAHLPRDIRVLAAKVVHDDFKPRKEALERVYRYFMPVRGLDIAAMRHAAKLFEGEKSFHSFCKTSERSPVRRLNRVSIVKKGDLVILSFSGDSFLWQMVRRITNALRMIGNLELTEEGLRPYFDPYHTQKIAPSPAEGLVLWDVRYAFSFEFDDYTKRRLSEELFVKRDEKQVELTIINAVLDELKKIFAL